MGMELFGNIYDGDSQRDLSPVDSNCLKMKVDDPASSWRQWGVDGHICLSGIPQCRVCVLIFTDVQ